MRNWWGKNWSTPAKLTSLLKRCTSIWDCYPHPPKRIPQAPSLAFLWQYLKYNWDLIAIFSQSWEKVGRQQYTPGGRKSKEERGALSEATQRTCDRGWLFPAALLPTPTSAPNIQDFIKLKFGNTVQLQAEPEMSEQYWHTLNSAIFNTSPCFGSLYRPIPTAAPQLANSANEKHVLVWIIWMTSCWEWRHMEGARVQAGAPEQKWGVKEPLPSVPQPTQ